MFYQEFIYSKCEIFHEPVDVSMEGCQDYYQIILDEMDLKKMENRVLHGGYKSIQQFQNDFELMIDNCNYFNYVCFGWGFEW